MKRLRYFLLAVTLIGIGAPAYAERLVLELQLTPLGFSPKHFDIPSNTPIQIKLTNNTNRVAELESYDMKFEKIVLPNGHISVFSAPLKAGEYVFFDDHSTNVTGVIRVKNP